MTLEPIPNSLAHVWSITMGLIIGSFVNVVIHRLPRRRSLVRPGSRCPRCHAPIRWWDNIPVASYLILGGKCRSCKKGISIRYPVIELLTAVLFFACEVKFGLGLPLLFRYWPLMALFVAITFIDLQRRIIPDELSLGGLVLGLITAGLAPALDVSLVGVRSWVVSFFFAGAGALLGYGVFYGLAWTYETLRGRTGLGAGDIKLLAMIGAFTGPYGVLSTVLISSVSGSLVGLTWALMDRFEKVGHSKQMAKQPKKSSLMQFSIPFGPFLVIGGLCTILLGDILWLQFMIPT